MRLSKSIGPVVMLLVVLLIVQANDIDYSTADFNDPNFNWESVRWEDIPHNRISDIPPQRIQIEYFLDEDRVVELTPAQLVYGDNLEKLPDLTLNREAARAAVEDMYGVHVEFGMGAVISGGFLKSTYGVEGSVPLDKLSEGTQVYIDEDGKVVLLGETILPETGKYLAKYDTETLVVTADGEFLVEGSLHYENGVAYAKEGVTIDHVSVGGDKVEIRFDSSGCVGKDNCISMDREERTIIVHGPNLDFSLKPGNVYLDVEPGDRLSFFLPGMVIIENDKVPSVHVLSQVRPDAKNSDKPDMFMYNGNWVYHVRNGDFLKGNAGDKDKGSVPFFLYIIDDRGAISPKMHGQTIYFDNKGEYYSVPSVLITDFRDREISFQEVMEDAVNMEELNDRFSEGVGKLRYKAILSDIKQISNIKKVVVDEDSDLMYQLRRFVQEMTPDMKSSINEIHVVSKSELVEVCGREMAAACATYDGKLYFTELSLNGDTFAHETFHALRGKRDRENELKAGKARREMQLRIMRENPEVAGFINNGDELVAHDIEGDELDIKIRITTLAEQFPQSKSRTFEDREMMGIEKLEKLDKEPSYRYPKEGYVSQYAQVSAGVGDREEVLAEVAGLVTSEPDFYSELCDSSSQFYQGRMGKPSYPGSSEMMTSEMAEEWSRRHRQDLDQVCRDGGADLNICKSILGKWGGYR